MKTILSRRRFFKPTLGTAMLLLIPGCGGGGTTLANSAAELSSTPSSTPSSTSGAGCAASFDFNHGHALTVLRSDLDSMTTVSYDIQGSADHTHLVTFTVAQLATLKTGASVTVVSSTTDYHQHVITVSCV